MGSARGGCTERIPTADDLKLAPRNLSISRRFFLRFNQSLFNKLINNLFDSLFHNWLNSIVATPLGAIKLVTMQLNIQ